MDFKEYREKFYQREPGEQDWNLVGASGVSIYVSDYAPALAFYDKVFGQPHYKEGADTHGWRLGRTWLTLFQSREGSPRNTEISLELGSKAEVDRLYQSFLSAGAQGDPAQETLMYVPVYAAFLSDPFGLSWTLSYQLPQE